MTMQQVTVRQYINGNNVYKASSSITGGYGPNISSHYSNMYTDFCIDTENDIVYKAIIGRTLKDLYLNNAQSTSGGSVTFPEQLTTLKEEGYTSSTVDKFWLLSYYEAYSLFLTNSDTQGVDASDERVWPTGSADYYWLRSPTSSTSNSARSVSTTGSLYNPIVVYSSTAARAAFTLTI